MPTRGACPQRTVGPLAGTYPTRPPASRWASGGNPSSVRVPRGGSSQKEKKEDSTIAFDDLLGSIMAIDLERAKLTILSPVPFGAAKRAKESSYHCSDTASQSQRCW